MKFKDYKLKTDKYGLKWATDEVILGDKECECFICHEPTKFVELNAEAHFCSDECVDEFYKQMFEAMRKSETKNVF